VKVTLEVPDYVPENGLQLLWEPAPEITAVLDPDGAVIVTANPDGLVSLARHLLALAQESVPAGRHIHLDAFNALEDDSVGLILERR